MSGPAVVLAASPVLLDPLDVIRDRDQLDLPAGSELRFCHYPTEQLVTLKEPLRASVSTHGITAENGRPLDLAATPADLHQSVKAALLRAARSKSLDELGVAPAEGCGNPVTDKSTDARAPPVYP